MKRLKKALAVLSAAAMFVISAPVAGIFAAETEPEDPGPVYTDGLLYINHFTYASVNDCGPGDRTEITVLDEFEGLPVTVVDYVCFSDCNTIKKVNLPETITSIDGYSFKNCSSLESINIPKSVNNISEAAFMGCSSLDNIVVPDGITEIKYSTFSWCTSLKNITLPDSIKTIKDYAFVNCSSLEDFKLPPNVKTVSSLVFNGCTKLNNLEIPASTDYLGRYTFSQCDTITKMTIPAAVGTVSGRIFYDCENLADVTIEEGITSIGESAFFACDSLKSLYIPASVTRIDVYSVGYTYDDVTPGGVKLIEGFSIKGEPGSAAEAYAKENGIKFNDGEVPGGNDPVYGDVNLDGVVTGSDVIVFMSHFLWTEKKLTGDALVNADVTRDDQVDITDLATLKMIVINS